MTLTWRLPAQVSNRGALKFAKNAFSNMVTGVSAAVFGLVLPYFFVRTFSPPEFALWILILQLGAYVGYLNFGLQAAIGRYVAHALERGDRKFAERMLAAGIQILCVLGLAGFGVIAVLAFAFHSIFPQAPAELIGTARTSLLLVGAALSLGLPFLGVLGVFIGLQRNDIPAIISTVSKLLTGVALVFGVYATRSLVAVCAVYLVCNVVTYVAQYWVYKRLCPDWRANVLDVDPKARSELISYCISLTIWSLMTLIVNGLQTTIVGMYDFRSVGAYGAALNVVTFFAGLVYTALAPLVQVYAKQHAKDDVAGMTRLLHATSFACTLALIVAGAWMILFSGPFFVAWIKPTMAAVALPIFAILTIANVIRGVSYPYMNYLIASSRQKQVVLTPMLEGFTNLAVALFFVAKFGALGVAIGTLVGGIVGVTGNFVYNMPRTLPEGVTVLSIFRSSILYPLSYGLPLVFLVAARHWLNIPFVGEIALAASASLLPVYGIWRHRGGLDLRDRVSHPTPGSKLGRPDWVAGEAGRPGG